MAEGRWWWWVVVLVLVIGGVRGILEFEVGGGGWGVALNIHTSFRAHRSQDLHTGVHIIIIHVSLFTNLSLAHLWHKAISIERLVKVTFAAHS